MAVIQTAQQPACNNNVLIVICTRALVAIGVSYLLQCLYQYVRRSLSLDAASALNGERFAFSVVHIVAKDSSKTPLQQRRRSNLITTTNLPKLQSTSNSIPSSGHHKQRTIHILSVKVFDAQTASLLINITARHWRESIGIESRPSDQ